MVKLVASGLGVTILISMPDDLTSLASVLLRIIASVQAFLNKHIGRMIQHLFISCQAIVSAILAETKIHPRGKNLKGEFFDSERK